MTFKFLVTEMKKLLLMLLNLAHLLEFRVSSKSHQSMAPTKFFTMMRFVYFHSNLLSEMKISMILNILGKLRAI